MTARKGAYEDRTHRSGKWVEIQSPGWSDWLYQYPITWKAVYHIRAGVAQVQLVHTDERAPRELSPAELKQLCYVLETALIAAVADLDDAKVKPDVVLYEVV